LIYFVLLIGIVLMVLTTKLIQNFNLSSNWLLLGQISLSLVIITVCNLEVNYIDQFELGYLATPFTLIFLVGFTNVMNMKEVQNPSILLLPCISLICLSIFAYFVGNSFVSITGVCFSLLILIILLYGYNSGKFFVGRAFNIAIGFIIGVLSISLIKISIVLIYIPIFTLALPLTLYYLIQNRLTSVQAVMISSLVGISFSLLIFIVPSNILWYLIVGVTIILVTTQFSRKYRFI
jgi:UDP-GlcNAc:undecaprenyl-phosphate/decaprenyl-phosphate GlcNAc-1-phosphate transferase